MKLLRELGWRDIDQGWIDLKFIVILPPAFDHRRSVLRRQKTSGVEVLIPQAAIERLDKAASLRLAGYD